MEGERVCNLKEVVMSMGMIFWLLMILWFIFGVLPSWPKGENANYWSFGGSILQFILFFLLGWKAFGFVVQG